MAERRQFTSPVELSLTTKPSTCIFLPQNRVAAICRIVLSIFLLTPSIGKTQEIKPPSSRIDFLRGGNIGFRLKWSGELFSGLGSRADALGGSISTLEAGAEAISANPAGLGFASGFHVTLDWAPPLKFDPTGILGIEGKINDGLKETAEDNSPGGILVPGTVENAQVNGTLDMRGGLKGGALVYGTSVISVAASFHQPFRVENQMSISGTEFNAAALNDDGEVTHRIFGTVNGNLNANLVVENSTFGFGAQLIPDKLALGLALDSYSGELNLEGTLLPEGIISTRNSEAFFNDPRRTQYDSLFANTRGDWAGKSARFRAGVAFRPREDRSLDFTLNFPFSLELTGPFSMVHNNIRALNLGAGQDEDILDVDILVEDNLTKTERRVTSIPGFKLQAPGQVSLGFSTRWQNYIASAVVVQYFGDLGYEFSFVQNDSLGVELESGRVRQGLNLGRAFRVGIGVEQLILGLGVVFAETFAEDFDLNSNQPKKNDRNSLFIPFVSLGGGVKLGRRLRLDYAVSPYNSSFLRFSTSYQL